MAEQHQFLDVVDRDEAERRFQAALELAPLGEERIDLSCALGRVLARDVTAPIDVPSFDRSNFDGFAIRAEDSFGAHEQDPRSVSLLSEVVTTGVAPRLNVGPGTAASIATGGMVPRGADAVLMVEHADVTERVVQIRKAITPGFGIAFAGTDIAVGETVLRRGELLTSRETGVLAAIGISQVAVWRRPRVAVLSTGDEIIAPGQPMQPAMVYDSNARVISDAVRELGGEPVEFGIVRDDIEALRKAVEDALTSCDLVLLSGGTSKGAGDLSYHVVQQYRDPGIVAHGVALKPGKPICLAASRGKAIVVLPGFPTSAIFTFHEFVAPVVRALGGLSDRSYTSVPAEMAVKVNSEIGRTEYLLVGLVESVENQAANDSEPHAGYVAFPMGKGSGSVTSFSRADGFVTLDRHCEILDARSLVQVRLLARDLQPSDLVVIGSHCIGLDYLLGRLQSSGLRTKFLSVGSTSGLQAAQREQCDLAGIHLLDPDSGIYNQPFLGERLVLVPGYRRLQGVIYRRGDRRFEGKSAEVAVAEVAADSECLMVNRNQGSGTRILIDRLLAGKQPAGYAVQSKSHNAVAAAVAQNRADWGVAIEPVARRAELGFLSLTEEHYDFAVPQARLSRRPVDLFRRTLSDDATRRYLEQRGFRPSE